MADLGKDLIPGKGQISVGPPAAAAHPAPQLIELAKAEQLLTTTKLSIDEIIYKAGFVNRGTFFKCFSAKYGCTPKVYRKEKLSQIRQEVGEESEDAADRSA